MGRAGGGHYVDLAGGEAKEQLLGQGQEAPAGTPPQRPAPQPEPRTRTHRVVATVRDPVVPSESVGPLTRLTARRVILR